MYPGRKRTATDWMIGIFVGFSVLFLLGAIAFGVYISNDGRIVHGSTDKAADGSILQRK